MARTPKSIFNEYNFSTGKYLPDMTEIDDQEALNIKLEALKTEHRDLDIAIDALIASGNINAFQLQRMKKRKLVLRDQILITENALLPDIIA